MSLRNLFRKEDRMVEIETRELKTARFMVKSQVAHVTRDGRSIKISFPWAGRFTDDDLFLDVDDIRRLAQFVEQTDPPGVALKEAKDG